MLLNLVVVLVTVENLLYISIALSLQIGRDVRALLKFIFGTFHMKQLLEFCFTTTRA